MGKQQQNHSFLPYITVTTATSSLIKTNQRNLHHISHCVYALATWKRGTTCPQRLLHEQLSSAARLGAPLTVLAVLQTTVHRRSLTERYTHTSSTGVTELSKMQSSFK